MLGESHDLVDELPEYRERILELRYSDVEFSELFDEYHEVNSEVIRIEQEIETPSDFYTGDLKKKRLFLKDKLYDLIQASK